MLRIDTFRIFIFLVAFLSSTLSAKADEASAERIKKLRSEILSQEEQEIHKSLSPKEREIRQSQIDAEVAYNFKKRIQMRPSEVKEIDPACDQWLLLYQETWSDIARQEIKKTCP